MLIVALVLAVVSLAALVTAVVTSNQVIAWVCIGLSALGVLLLIVDAIRDRNRSVPAGTASGRDRTEVLAPVVAGTDVLQPVESETSVIVAVDADAETALVDSEYLPGDDEIVEDHPEELVFDEPDHDIPSDDEPVYPMAAEEAAVHAVDIDDDVIVETEVDAEIESEADAVATTDESSSVTASYVIVDTDGSGADDSEALQADTEAGSGEDDGQETDTER